MRRFQIDSRCFRKVPELSKLKLLQIKKLRFELCFEAAMQKQNKRFEAAEQKNEKLSKSLMLNGLPICIFLPSISLP